MPVERLDRENSDLLFQVLGNQHKCLRHVITIVSAFATEELFLPKPSDTENDDTDEIGDKETNKKSKCSQSDDKKISDQDRRKKNQLASKSEMEDE